MPSYGPKFHWIIRVLRIGVKDMCMKNKRNRAMVKY